MKIYRFIDTTGHQKAGNEFASAAHRSYRTQRNAERELTASDSVEISEEARRRYETLHVREREKALIKKISGEYLPFIDPKINHKGDIASSALHYWEVQSLKRTIRLGDYNFNAQHIISETAEAIQSFLLAS